MSSKIFKIFISLAVLTAIIFMLILYFSNVAELHKEMRIRPLPNSAEILFVSNRDSGSRIKEIYSMDSDGGHVTRITFTGLHHTILGIDKSRRYIVVTRAVVDTTPPSGLGDEDRKSVWIIDLKTGEEKKLTDFVNNAEGDSFSPDGEWIVFHMVLSGESQSDIYKIKRDGTELTRLTYTESYSECDPEWSSDGKNIVFTLFDPNIGRFVLKTMDNNGHNIKTIYDCEDNISTPNFPPGVYDPSWSSDDQWIVFEKSVEYHGENGGAGIWHIFKIHPNGTGLVDLSEAGGHINLTEYKPSFSPYDRFIIFTARYTASTSNQANIHIDIFKMNIHGKIIQRLTNDSFYEEYPVWIKQSD